MLRSASLCLLLTAMFLFAGCGGTKSNSSISGGANSATGQGKLYVSDSAHNTIFRFDGALASKGTLNANVAITGAATTLANPGYVVLDPAADRLFVANRGSGVISPSILIFEQVHANPGTMAPARAISGNVTQVAVPADMALDVGNDLLYVADKNTNTNNAATPGPGSILVFAQAATINGNSPPVRTFNLSFLPTAIFLNAATQTLYVADGAHNAIDVFTQVNNLPTGMISTNQIITKGTSAVDNTLLSNHNGLQLDSAGRLLVSNAGSQIVTVYANAATASGNVSPAAVVGGGSTGISAPAQLTINPATSDLYIADGSPGADGGI